MREVHVLWSIVLLYIDAQETVSYLGGCKTGLSYTDLNSRMKCKTECDIGSIGRDGDVNFRWLVVTPRTYMGLMTVQNRHLGYPAPDDPYIAIIRLDRKFCDTQLLRTIEKNRNIRFDAGDLSESNHWLESMSFINGVGESWTTTGLFIQLRRGTKEPKEIITKNGKRDQFYITMTLSNPNFLDFHGLTIDDVKTCLSKAHLSVIRDDGTEPYSNDYTRCAAYQRYGKPVDWTEDEFVPTPPVPPKQLPAGVKCNGNPFSSGGRIFDGEQAESNSWPWIARMSRGGQNGDWSCGGTIIAENWILTAAHCCDNTVNDWNRPEWTRWVIGDVDQYAYDAGEREVQSLEWFIHPLLDLQNYDYYSNMEDEQPGRNTRDYWKHNYNVCLIRTEPMGLMSANVNSDIACLPKFGEHINPNDDYLPDGPNCFVAGWGDTKYWTGGDIWIPVPEEGKPAKLHSTYAKIFSAEYCSANSDYHTGSGFKGFDDVSEFCAGDLLTENPTGLCMSDTGYPLVCINENNEPVLYGVGSWVLWACGYARRPMLLVKVAAVMDWITETVNNN